MYDVTDSAEGDCYLCVPPNPGIEAAALGASEFAAPGTGESAAPGAGDTTLTPLGRPVAVSLADPSRGPILAHSSTVLSCPAALSGLLSGLHLPSFSTNLVSGADLQDAWVDQFTPGGQRVTHCTCSRTGRHLATFTRRPGSSLYTLTTASPSVTVSGQVAASGQDPAPSGVSQVDPVEPVEVAVDSGAAPGGAEPGGAEPECAESGGPPGVLPRREPLSPQRLREWYAECCSRAAGATGPAARGASGAGAAGGASGAGAAGAAGPAGVGAAGAAGAAGPGGARTGGTGAAWAGGAAGVGAVGAGAVATRGAAGAGAVGARAVSIGGAAGARAAGGTGAAGAVGVVVGDPGAEGTDAVSAVSGGTARPRPYYVPLLQQSQSQLQPASPLPGPSPYSGPTRGLTERREPESRPASPESRPASRESRPELPIRAVCTGCRVLRQRPPPVPGTHSMTMRPSTAPQRVPLPSPPTSSLPDGPDPESDSLRAASPTVTRFLATAVTRAPREWHDTLRTTLAALGFAPSTADPSLFLRTDTTLSPFYVRVYVDDLVFATADTEALAHVKSELQKRHTCTDLGELTSYLGLRITRDRAQRTITLTQSHMVQHVLQRFGFTYSSPHSTPLPTGHSLSAPPSDESVEPSGPCPELVGCLIHKKEKMDAAKRVLRYLCSTSGMGLVLGGQTRVVFTGHADASWADDLTTQWSSQGYTFSLGSGCVSWRSTRSSSVLSSSCEAEIYAGAMAALELRWLTYLLANLGEPPRSPPVVYVDNKAMIALCREHKLEHRMKHIALRYFLAQELQQRGQLRLAYVASRSDTADVFTKALQPCDHHSFCTVLGLCDSRDGLSLFDLTSGASTAPAADADSTVRSQWLTRDAAARLAVRSHLPPTERAHFSQYKSAKTLYDAVVARYSSPATAALSRLMLPYLFPDLAAFATVTDLITHLRTSDTRYRAALPAEFCAQNPPPMYITLYYLVTRLPDILRSVMDHFLSLCPTTLTVNLLEERLLAAETSITAIGASRGDPLGQRCVCS
ncbi:unnamed protein product [Closterium sp. NIES-54]